MKPRNALLLLAKLALSAAALYYVFTRRVSPGALRDAAAATNAYLLAGACLLSLAVRWLTALQFHQLARAVGPVPSVARIMKAQLISSLFASVAPGELVSSGVSWHYLARDNGTYASTGAVLVYLKLMAYAVIALLAIAGVILEPRLGGMHILAIAAAVLLLCVAGAAPFWHGPSAAAVQGAAESLLGKLPLGSWSRLASQVPGRLLILHDLPMARLLAPLVLAFLINAIGAAAIACIFRSAGVMIPWHACLWIRAVLTVVQAAPISIAGTGVRELTLVFLLGRIFGTPSAEVVLASLLFLGVNLFYGLLVGGSLFLLDHGSSPLEASSNDRHEA